MCIRDRPLSDHDYMVRGCTALLDAIGGAIHHIGNIHKYARREDVPEHIDVYKRQLQHYKERMGT